MKLIIELEFPTQQLSKREFEALTQTLVLVAGGFVKAFGIEIDSVIYRKEEEHDAEES